MAKKVFVYSTIVADVSYVEYLPGPPGGLPTEGRKVTIKGGAGVADKRLVTVNGVVTEITEDDLAFLMNDANFQRHLAAGFLTYENQRFDLDAVVADMNHEDGSRPLTEADYEEGGRAYLVGLDGKPMKAPKVAAA